MQQAVGLRVKAVRFFCLLRGDFDHAPSMRRFNEGEVSLRRSAP